MGLLNYGDETSYDGFGETKEEQHFKELKSQLHSIMTSLERLQRESQPSERYLTRVSYRIFDRDFEPIRTLTKCQAMRVPTGRGPTDTCHTMVFYHPVWKQMPVAQIIIHFSCGFTTKEYYLNSEYCRVLRSMTNEDTNTDTH